MRITCHLGVTAGEILFYNSPFLYGALKSHKHFDRSSPKISKSHLDFSGLWFIW